MPCHKLYKDKGALEIWQEEMARKRQIQRLG